MTRGRNTLNHPYVLRYEINRKACYEGLPHVLNFSSFIVIIGRLQIPDCKNFECIKECHMRPLNKMIST